jgi:putative mRNA 3-end processing factor
MLESGLKVNTHEGPMRPPVKPHAIFYGHAHLDHIGYSAVFHRDYKCKIFGTKPTKEQTVLLLNDSIKIARLEHKPQLFSKEDVAQLTTSWKNVRYRDTVKLGGAKIEVRDAGHVPGSCCFVVNVDGKRILYTSDYKLERTASTKGADILDLDDIDMMVMESTYSPHEHTPQLDVEKEFGKVVRGIVEGGGTALVPSFAMRAPKLLVVLKKLGLLDHNVYLDGMGRAAVDIALNNPEYITNYKLLKSAANSVTFIHNWRQRKEAVKGPNIIVTTSGCLTGGPIVTYLKHLYLREDCGLVLTGFQIPGTPGRYLLDTGRFVNDEMDLKLKIPLHQFDFSGHTGRSGLFRTIKKIRPSKVVAVHGEYCDKFATEVNGRFPEVKAYAPTLGQVIDV